MSADSKDYEMGKRKLERLTPVGRARKHRKHFKTATERLAQSLGKPGAKKPELIDIAAARLEALGKGNPVAEFEYASAAYLGLLRWEPGNAIPLENFWSQLLGLVEEFNPQLAQTFARNFKQQFAWCLAGHVHRLNMEYDQRPEAIQAIEIYRKGKKTTFVALRRDGRRALLEVSDFPRLDPWVCFAGTRARPVLSAADFKRLEGMDAKHAVESLESGKFKLTYPPNSVLFTTDTVLNVAMPRKLDEAHLTLSALRPLPPKLARKYGGP